MTAPPGGHSCRVFEFTDVVRILDINPTTLTTWISFAKMVRPFGDKVGHRRVFSQAEVFALSLMVTLAVAGIPVSPAAVSASLDAAFGPDGPIVPDPSAVWNFHQSNAVGIVVYSGTIWRDIDRKLKELEN